jgi:propanol-preferring alcohol dehydrogenase
MRAAVLTKFREPLSIEEVPDPTAGPTDAVVRVEACGVCRSDWHLWQHDWTWAGVELALPAVPGHEIGGVVEEVGSEIGRFKPGDRVTVPFHLACGRCEYCFSGRSNLCLAYGIIGVHRGGGYGQYVCVPNADVNLVALPDAVDPLASAALGCRFMTAYHGLADQAKVRPGEWVAVFGIGAVGLSTVQIASALGARVIAVSHSQEKLAQAKAEGAVVTLQASATAAFEVKEVTSGGADLAVDAVGSSENTVAGILALRKGGRHLQLGLTGKADQGVIGIPADAMVLQEIQFLGSLGCPTTSYPGLLSLVASGQLDPTRLVERSIGVEQVSGVLQAMTDGTTRGFTVITAW